MQKRMNERSLKANEIKFGFMFLGFMLILSNQVLVSTSYGLKFQSPPRSIAYNDLIRGYWPTEGWQVSTPTAQNLSKTRLNEMSAYVKEEGFAIDSILIVRNGYIVFEQYLNPEYNQSSLHPIFSCTKSVLSVLIGIAIDKGYIESVDQKILDFFPNQTFANPDPRKENITIKHLLTMTSGLDWHELDVSYDDACMHQNERRPSHTVILAPLCQSVSRTTNGQGGGFIYSSRWQADNSGTEVVDWS